MSTEIKTPLGFINLNQIWRAALSMYRILTIAALRGTLQQMFLSSVHPQWGWMHVQVPYLPWSWLLQGQRKRITHILRAAHLFTQTTASITLLLYWLQAEGGRVTYYFCSSIYSSSLMRWNNPLFKSFALLSINGHNVVRFMENICIHFAELCIRFLKIFKLTKSHVIQGIANWWKWVEQGIAKSEP